MSREAIGRILGYLAFVAVVLLTMAFYFHDQEQARIERCKAGRTDTKTAIVATVLYAFQNSPNADASQIARSAEFVNGLKDLLDDTLSTADCR